MKLNFLSGSLLSKGEIGVNHFDFVKFLTEFSYFLELEQSRVSNNLQLVNSL